MKKDQILSTLLEHTSFPGEVCFQWKTEVGNVGGIGLTYCHMFLDYYSGLILAKFMPHSPGTYVVNSFLSGIFLKEVVYKKLENIQLRPINLFAPPKTDFWPTKANKSGYHSFQEAAKLIRVNVHKLTPKIQEKIIDPVDKFMWKSFYVKKAKPTYRQLQSFQNDLDDWVNYHNHCRLQRFGLIKEKGLTPIEILIKFIPPDLLSK